jgi:hypothetical protein
MAAARPIVGAVLHYNQYIMKVETANAADGRRNSLQNNRLSDFGCVLSHQKGASRRPTLNFPVYKRISAALLEQVDLH